MRKEESLPSLVLLDDEFGFLEARGVRLFSNVVGVFCFKGLVIVEEEMHFDLGGFLNKKIQF